MSRRLVSVGDTLAREGETFLDVVHRKEWGEGGPFIAEMNYLASEKIDPGFLAVWHGADAKRKSKFVYGFSRVLAPVTDGLMVGDFEKAQRILRYIQPKLRLRVRELWDNNAGAWEVTMFPCPGCSPVTIRMAAC